MAAVRVRLAYSSGGCAGIGRGISHSAAPASRFILSRAVCARRGHLKHHEGYRGNPSCVKERRQAYCVDGRGRARVAGLVLITEEWRAGWRRSLIQQQYLFWRF